MLLTARNLSKMYGPRLLFSGITLGLTEGQRVGLIGANGSGKSTLLKIFAGVEVPDDGVVEAKRGLSVGYVPQKDQFAEATVLEVVTAAVSHAHDDHEKEMKAEIVLDQTGFKDIKQEVKALSGGWRKRLAIARELAREPELLLMDEPTNHLDLEGIEWLEDIVSRGEFGTLTVSHDRRFLEESVTRIIELSKQYPDGFLSCDGTYSAFVEKRAEFLEAQAGREQALASTVRREIEWLRRGAKARTTKAKGRIERAGEMMAELSKLKERNIKQGAAGLDFTASERQTRKMVELKKVSKTLGGRQLFKDVSVIVGPGTRLGLLGPNGSGKSTLIKILTGRLDADGGSVTLANNLKVVVFDQHRETLDPKLTLRDALSPGGDTLQFQGEQMHISSWAKKFLFRTESLDLPVSELSGGEQSRVLIARLMLTAADVLILDEPTNDLDIPTLDVLEEALEDFKGAVILVTHDRYLLDRLSTELLALGVSGDDVTSDGAWATYAELAQWERAREERIRAKSLADREASDSAKRKAAAAAPPVVVAPPPAKKGRLSWKEQKELEGMEAAIHTAEAEHGRWQAITDDPKTHTDHTRSHEAYAKLGATQTEIDRLYARWAELEAKTA